jgi:hypothetical protein
MISTKMKDIRDMGLLVKLRRKESREKMGHERRENMKDIMGVHWLCLSIFYGNVWMTNLK